VEDRIVVNAVVAIPLSEVELRVSRSSGPGGQHANVTASRVEAVFDVETSRSLTEAQKERVITRAGPHLTAVAQDYRSQARNRELAIERLRSRLAAALEVPRPRRPTQPTRQAHERRLESKRRTGEQKRARQPPSLEEG
jgi:ribosome-associated protein